MIDFESDQAQVELQELQTFAQLHGRDCRVVRWAFAYRRLRNKIWWQGRRWLLSKFHKGPAKDNRLHVYWHFCGGIGDCAAHRVCVQAWRKKLPNAVFYYDSQIADATKMLFVQDDKNIVLPGGKDPLWYKYDLCFELCLSFYTAHVNQKRVQQIAPEIMPVVQEGLRRQARLKFFVEDHYMCDDMLGRFIYHHRGHQLEALRYLSAVDFDVYETGLLHLSLRNPKVLDKFGLSGKKYITIHSGIGINLPGGYPLKCWPEGKWKEFVRLFKAVYPDILVVQLGGPRSPKFDFADICLVGQTRLTDIAALIDNALLHVDGESGFVQLTRWLTTKAVVIFSNTSPDFYAMPKNKALVNTVCEYCMWVGGPAWHTVCPCGHKTCKNLDAITPQQVLDAVKEELH